MPHPARSARALERRRKILAAARAVFQESGGLSAGLRPIAAAAGCTTGAIYASFASKEDIYAALLEDSLRELAAAVAGAAAKAVEPEAVLRAAASAFFEFYQSRAFELRLGLYLFEQDGRTGLGSERDKALNARLAETLDVFAAAFARLGAPSEALPQEPRDLANGLFAALIGVLVMAISGRDHSLKTDATRMLDGLLDIHLASLKK